MNFQINRGMKICFIRVWISCINVLIQQSFTLWKIRHFDRFAFDTNMITSLEVILSYVFFKRETTVLCNNGGIICLRHRVFVKNNCMGTQSRHNCCVEKMRCFSLSWCCVCSTFSCGKNRQHSLSHINRLYGH